MLHDPNLTRGARRLTCICAVCFERARSSATIDRFRAAFGWLGRYRNQVSILGAVAVAAALILIPGRVLFAAVAPHLGLG